MRLVKTTDDAIHLLRDKELLKAFIYLTNKIKKGAKNDEKFENELKRVDQLLPSNNLYSEKK